jgi:subtilisin family serine protease
VTKSIVSFVFLLLLLATTPLVAQRAGDVVPGEIIIQMRPAAETSDILSEFSAAGLKSERLLSRRMNIWLISYDTKKANGDDLLFALRSHPLVSIVQYNHVMDLRDDKNYSERNPEAIENLTLDSRGTTPNDPRFNEQWALNNTGQSGGTPDADIDAPEAWDLAKGGLTALGDTIVVAVIDGGAQISHPDLNFWVNRFEIPNNSIDDDLNGYVDDYLGWNAYSNNGTPDGDSHGTHVSGIVAARGNNGAGVSGVNWNTKVMIISGSSSSEATVVAAYAFALEHRATYNETNGAKGAFVVATNSSFGVDYGQPANYPIWCAMYDSLGKYGILSCGATANLGINVDVQGDIPTACPSNWLVSVTNTTSSDARNSGAGYGLTTIDLGAPGSSILSTDQTNTYTSKTGTSMATPTVAGAIALMISGANANLIQAYKTNPGPTALLFKQYLLEATDPVAALQGQTVSGGRLNVFKALLAVGTPPDTVAPTAINNLAVVDPTSESVKLTWTAPLDTSRNGVVSYIVRKSNSPILTQTDFDNASPVAWSGTPQPSGGTENFVVGGLAPASTHYFAVRAQDTWGNTSVISNSPSGTTLQAPAIGLSTRNLVRTLTPGSSVLDSIMISNTTAYASTLSYTVELANNTFPQGSMFMSLVPVETENVPQLIKFADKENPTPRFGYTIDGMGGPDSAGYKWIDSYEPNGPVFEWEDISTTGTELTNWVASSTFGAKDEGYAQFSPGSTFKYYGQQYNTLYVGSNGFISVAPFTGSTFTNATMPGSPNPNGIMAAMWDDLDGTNGGKVYYKYYPGKTIIQYTNWQKYSASTSNLNFQIILFSSGKILYQYQTMTGTLNSATVGIENQTGTVGLTVAHNATYIANNLALQFQAEPDWITATSLSGMLYNGNSSAVKLNLSTVEIPLGNYSMDLVIRSNDPLKPVDTVKVSMINSVEVPVELVSFTGEFVNGSVKLNWITATETNNSGFEVERKSGNGIWEKAGFVPGAGTKTSQSVYSFSENKLVAGKYLYRLKQIDLDGTTAYSQEVEVDMGIPTEFTLDQNFPNPFNPNTIIRFALPVAGGVSLNIYNTLGEKVASLINKEMAAGYHEVSFNASELPSGLYLYELRSGDFSSVRKMLLMK